MIKKENLSKFASPESGPKGEDRKYSDQVLILYIIFSLMVIYHLQY